MKKRGIIACCVPPIPHCFRVRLTPKFDYFDQSFRAQESFPQKRAQYDCSVRIESNVEPIILQVHTVNAVGWVGETDDRK